MALPTSSAHGISSAAETSENALQPPPSSSGLAKCPVPLFKLISDDILINIFSRLEQDPRDLARLACVCRVFAHVVRNVCWKRQCTRIVPEIMPSPQMQLDQIPEQLGGWGALMKLLVCCPGLKHAGIASPSWDCGLECEIGPMELYNIQPRYAPKARIAADNGVGELLTRDASVSGAAATMDSPVQSYTLSVRDSSVRSYAISRSDSCVGSNLDHGIGSRQVVVGKSLVKVESGDSNGSGESSGKGSSATTLDGFVQRTGSAIGNSNGYGQSSEKSCEMDSLAKMDVFVQGTGSCEQSASSNNDPDVRLKGLAEGGGQEEEKSAALREESSRSSLAKSTPAGIDVFGLQGSLSGEFKAPSAPVDGSFKSGTELSNAAPVAMNKSFPIGCGHVGMSTATVENNGGSASIEPSPALEMHRGSGRPPRAKPIKRVQWKEEGLASKEGDNKVAGSKFGCSGEHGIDRDRDRARSRKRKERALRLLLAKVPEDPKQRLHIVPAKWTLPREEGSRLLASRFRCDSLYICDWPGCVHPGEKRNYKLFRGFFKNFKTSLMWRNLNDMNARKTNIACAFCSATSTWDMMTAFCLRRSFQYHDDGEPVVQARVCENGHVSGAWTDRPGVFIAH